LTNKKIFGVRLNPLHPHLLHHSSVLMRFSFRSFNDGFTKRLYS